MHALDVYYHTQHVELVSAIL